MDMLNILSDMLIVAKLLVYCVYTTIEVLIKNLLVPGYLLNKSVRNKVVLITGGAGGIGRHLVEIFLTHEARVVCIDCNKSNLDNLKSMLPSKLHKNLHLYNVDVTRRAEISKCALAVQDQVGAVDILINNAGIANEGKLFVELNEQEMQRIFDVNVMAQMYMCRQFLPGMMERNSGHIVNMSSSLGQFGAFRVVDYCASKFAVAGFTEALRIEMKTIQPSIKVTLICPYHVNTDLFKGFEMNSFQWANVAGNDPRSVAQTIVDGILQEKELIGYPKIQFYLFLAIKNLITTKATDCMMIWFGFNEAINKTRKYFAKN